MGEMMCSRHCLWLGTLVLIAFFFGQARATNSTSNVNNNGDLTYSPLPDGDPYSTPGSFDEGSFPLPTTWAFIGSFLTTVSPGSPPYDLINNLIGDPSSLEISTLSSSVLDYKDNLLGFAICFVLGLLFVLIFPIVALCFCCCRCCCKKCGGKLHQDVADNSCTRAVVYGLFLLVSITFVFAGAVTALCISGYTGDTAQKLPSTVENNFNDLLAYVNNTLNEIDFVMSDQLGWTLDQVRNDLNGIGVEVGEPVRDVLSTNVTPAIDAVIALEATINFTLYTLIDIDDQQANMETSWEAINDTLTTILADLETTCTSCSCCTNANATKRDITINADYRDIDYSGMFSGSFPQQLVNLSIIELTDVVGRDLSAQAREGAESFENIPETLTNTTSSDVADIIATIDSLEETLGQQINETTSSLSGLDETVIPFRNTATNALQDYADNFDQYRAIVMYVFYGFMLFIVLLFLLGVLVGCCGYDSKALPTERGACSNCGALFLMAGAGFVFVFGALFMIIASLTFIIGGPIDRLVCDPITSGELFTETIDREDAIIPGYYLGKNVFKDPSVPLTVTNLLSECENNQGIYTAFQLDALINISQFTDISSQIPNVNDQFANITGDFTNIDILTADTRQTLINFRDSPADNINWTIFTNELAKEFIVDGAGSISNSLSTLIMAVTADAAATSGLDQTTLNGIAGNLTTLQTVIDALMVAVGSIDTTIDSLTNTTSTIDTLVNDTIAAAESAQAFIDSSVEDTVQDVIVGFSARVLGYPEQFVNYTTEQLRFNIGGCRPVYNLWNEATNTLCIGLLRSFNGLWFTLGWCVVFLIPSLIFGVKLAKYCRTMESTDGRFNNRDMEMQPGYGHSNKVAPSYDA